MQRIALTIILLAGLAAPASARATEPAGLEQALSAAAEALELPPQLDAALVVDGDYCGLIAPTSAPNAVPRFHAASITKLLTAIVVFSLEEDGALSIGDPVGDYVAAFDGSPITIGHLLTHTSGLRDRQRAAGRESAAEVGDYIEALAAQTVRVEPGSRWSYADAGYNLLGIVIESATGLPYVDVVVERVLEPLGMRDSTFFPDQLPDGDRVTAYDRRGRALRHPWDRAFLPSSGLQTTAADLVRFAGAVLAIAAGDDDGIVTRATLARMTTRQIATGWQGIAQGYGFQIAETPAGPQWRHAGGEAGFESLLTLYPRHDLGIALLGNRADWPRFEFERAVSEAVLASGGGCD
jgi:CubicO group peptidase (beta-lactamase class C family)